MKAHQVRAQQALHDLGAPGHLHEQLDGRERDVQKKPDRQIGSEFAQHRGDQLQLIVLHPDDRALGCGACRRLGEPAVDVDVAVPPLPVVDRFDDDVVVQRPQRGVGETLVILFDVVGRQPHRVQPEVLIVDGLVFDIHVVVDDPGPPDPGAATAAQQWLQRSDQTTRAAFPVGGAVGQSLHVDRQPVGDDDEVGHTGGRAL